MSTTSTAILVAALSVGGLCCAYCAVRAVFINVRKCWKDFVWWTGIKRIPSTRVSPGRPPYDPSYPDFTSLKEVRSEKRKKKNTARTKAKRAKLRPKKGLITV